MPRQRERITEELEMKNSEVSREPDQHSGLDRAREEEYTKRIENLAGAQADGRGRLVTLLRDFVAVLEADTDTPDDLRAVEAIGHRVLSLLTEATLQKRQVLELQAEIREIREGGESQSGDSPGVDENTA